MEELTQFLFLSLGFHLYGGIQEACKDYGHERLDAQGKHQKEVPRETYWCAMVFGFLALIAIP
jgi:hypothetical protein